MLVLSRKPGQTIVLAGSIIVKILRRKGKAVAIGIEAPPGVSVRRGELEPSDALERLIAARDARWAAEDAKLTGLELADD